MGTNLMRDRDNEPVDCQSGLQPYGSNCLVCQARVIIHCSDCTRQVTACQCTLPKKAERDATQEQN